MSGWCLLDCGTGGFSWTEHVIVLVWTHPAYILCNYDVLSQCLVGVTAGCFTLRAFSLIRVPHPRVIGTVVPKVSCQHDNINLQSSPFFSSPRLLSSLLSSHPFLSPKSLIRQYLSVLPAPCFFVCLSQLHHQLLTEAQRLAACCGIYHLFASSLFTLSLFLCSLFLCTPVSAWTSFDPPLGYLMSYYFTWMMTQFSCVFSPAVLFFYVSSSYFKGKPQRLVCCCFHFLTDGCWEDEWGRQ